MALPEVAHSREFAKELEELVGSALLYCGSKTGSRTMSDVKAALLAGEEWSLSYMVYALGQGIANLAAGEFVGVKEAYVSGLEGDDSASPFYPVILILCVNHVTRQVVSFVERVETELPGCLERVAGLTAQRARTLMNITVLGEDEVAAGTGFAVAISSLWSPPLRVLPD